MEAGAKTGERQHNIHFDKLIIMKHQLWTLLKKTKNYLSMRSLSWFNSTKEISQSPMPHLHPTSLHN